MIEWSQEKNLFESIDPIIYSWAGSYNLHLLTEDRDWQIRRIHVNQNGFRHYGINIDPPTEAGKIVVSIRNMKEPYDLHKFEADKESLRDILDRAFEIATGKVK